MKQAEKRPLIQGLLFFKRWKKQTEYVILPLMSEEIFIPSQRRINRNKDIKAKSDIGVDGASMKAVC